MAGAIRDAFQGRSDDPFQGEPPNPAQFALQMIEGVPLVRFWRGDPPAGT
jgi:hypothetical protein